MSTDIVIRKVLVVVLIVAIAMIRVVIAAQLEDDEELRAAVCSVTCVMQYEYETDVEMELRRGCECLEYDYDEILTPEMEIAQEMDTDEVDQEPTEEEIEEAVSRAMLLQELCAGGALGFVEHFESRAHGGAILTPDYLMLIDVDAYVDTDTLSHSVCTEIFNGVTHDQLNALDGAKHWNKECARVSASDFYSRWETPDWTVTMNLLFQDENDDDENATMTSVFVAASNPVYELNDVLFQVKVIDAPDDFFGDASDESNRRRRRRRLAQVARSGSNSVAAGVSQRRVMDARIGRYYFNEYNDDDVDTLDAADDSNPSSVVLTSRTGVSRTTYGTARTSGAVQYTPTTVSRSGVSRQAVRRSGRVPPSDSRSVQSVDTERRGGGAQTTSRVGMTGRTGQDTRLPADDFFSGGVPDWSQYNSINAMRMSASLGVCRETLPIVGRVGDFRGRSLNRDINYMQPAMGSPFGAPIAAMNCRGGYSNCGNHEFRFYEGRVNELTNLIRTEVIENIRACAPEEWFRGDPNDEFNPGDGNQLFWPHARSPSTTSETTPGTARPVWVHGEGRDSIFWGSGPIPPCRGGDAMIWPVDALPRATLAQTWNVMWECCRTSRWTPNPGFPRNCQQFRGCNRYLYGVNGRNFPANARTKGDCATNDSGYISRVECIGVDCDELRITCSRYEAINMDYSDFEYAEIGATNLGRQFECSPGYAIGALECMPTWARCGRIKVTCYRFTIDIRVVDISLQYESFQAEEIKFETVVRESKESKLTRSKSQTIKNSLTGKVNVSGLPGLPGTSFDASSSFVNEILNTQETILGFNNQRTKSTMINVVPQTMCGTAGAPSVHRLTITTKTNAGGTDNVNIVSLPAFVCTTRGRQPLCLPENCGNVRSVADENMVAREDCQCCRPGSPEALSDPSRACRQWPGE